MRFFRKEYSLKTFATLTGLVFLNLSFFLAELNALEFSKNNKALYETLISAVAGISEEEKDMFGGESGYETESLSKQIDICLDLFQHVNKGCSFTCSTNGTSHALFPCDGATGNVHQPPEQQA